MASAYNTRIAPLSPGTECKQSVSPTENSGHVCDPYDFLPRQPRCQPRCPSQKASQKATQKVTQKDADDLLSTSSMRMSRQFFPDASQSNPLGASTSCRNTPIGLRSPRVLQHARPSPIPLEPQPHDPDVPPRDFSCQALQQAPILPPEQTCPHPRPKRGGRGT
jgi:hypothetical protein